MPLQRILVVDDDPEMRSMLSEFLQRNGFMAAAAASEAGIAEHIGSARIDLILLDVMLGDENGIAICKKLRREQDVPIILVSALSADHERMAGYEVGADDYIAKPFNPDLLLARVRAVLRRGQRTASLLHRRTAAAWRFSRWRYDARRRELLSDDGYQVALSRREADLLSVLLANPGIPLTREEIAAALDADGRDNDGASDGTGDADAASRGIDMLVRRLRSKIEVNPKEPRLLLTERGTGYLFTADVDEERS